MITRVIGTGAIVGAVVYVLGQSMPLQSIQTDRQLADVVGGASCYVDATSNCPGGGSSNVCAQSKGFCSNFYASTPCPIKGTTFDREKQNSYDNASLGGPGRQGTVKLPQIDCTIQQTCAATCSYYLTLLGYYCDGTDADINPRTPEIVDTEAPPCKE